MRFENENELDSKCQCCCHTTILKFNHLFMPTLLMLLPHCHFCHSSSRFLHFLCSALLVFSRCGQRSLVHVHMYVRIICRYVCINEYASFLLFPFTLCWFYALRFHQHLPRAVATTRQTNDHCDLHEKYAFKTAKLYNSGIYIHMYVHIPFNKFAR